MPEAQPRTDREPGDGRHELRDSEERFLLLVEGVRNYGISMLDPDGRVVSWSSGAEGIHGYGAEDIVGQPFACLYPPEDVEDGKPGADLAAAMAEGLLEEEGIRLRKDGSRFAAHVTITPLRDEGGELRGFEQVTRDTSGRQDVEAALGEAEERFRKAFDYAPIGMAVVALDGRFLRVNEALCEITGYTGGELVDKKLESITYPEDRAAHAKSFARLVSGEVRAYRAEERYVHAAGDLVWVAFSASVVEDPDGAPLYLVAQIEDVTQRKRAEEQLRESEERFRLLVEGVEDYAIFMLEPDGRVASWNSGAERIKGYSSEEIIGRHCSIFYPPEDIRRGKPDVDLRTAAAEGRFEEEGWRLRKDGSRFLASLAITPLRDPSSGRVRGFAKVTRDVTERRRLEEQLSHQALHDALTGLPNRTLFLDRVTLALSRTQRKRSKVALLFLDLDGFKAINDTLGHRAGDDLLVALAARLRHLMRPGDTISRFGGDEFTILCEDLGDERDAVAIAERMRDAIEAPFSVEGREVSVTGSIGIALGGSGESPDSLLAEADAAVYRAKDRGKARYELAEHDGGGRPSGAERADTPLHGALERGELRVFYQPQVDLKTGAIAGVEALVRWEHPERGLLAPAEFISLAEETGLIFPIGEFLLEEASRQVAAWAAARPDSRPLTVAANLSASQLARQDLAATVSRALLRSGLDPDMLCLEITESVLMSNTPSTVTALLALKGLGVRLAIDDFGAGHSSLAYLRRFPVHVLKVDSSFVEGLGARSDDSAIVSAVVGMGHALGLDVLAEGAETLEQVTELRALGCDLAQGYYFARPEPAEVVDQMLATGPGWLAALGEDAASSR